MSDQDSMNDKTMNVKNGDCMVSKIKEPDLFKYLNMLSNSLPIPTCWLDKDGLMLGANDNFRIWSAIPAI